MNDEIEDDKDDSGHAVPYYFRYYDKEKRKYHGLFMVAFGKSGTGQYGFFYKDCLNNEEAYGPFASVEDAVADARGSNDD